jgi:DNA modification methylase
LPQQPFWFRNTGDQNPIPGGNAMRKRPALKLVHGSAQGDHGRSDPSSPAEMPAAPQEGGERVLARMLEEGVMEGDSLAILPLLPRESVDLFFMSPPYADARAYSRIHPDRYVEWFLPFARAMFDAAKPTGSLIINIKNRVANRGPLKGQRHPYVYQLVLALQNMGWRWVETYIWAKPNAVPGRFGPRTKDSFEYVYHFARGNKPFFDLSAVRVPYKADASEIDRRKKDTLGRRSTEAGFGRDRTKTYLLGGADPGNVVSVAQTYNQHKGVAHTAAMPEGLAQFFILAASPAGGVVIDPFAGGATTVVVGRRLGRRAAGIELHEAFAKEGRRRIAAGLAADTPGRLIGAMKG